MQANAASVGNIAVVQMKGEMVPEVARLHFDAFAGYMNTRLGSAYVQSFINWFCQTDDAIALVATRRDGKIVGYVVGAALGYGKVMNRDLIWVAASGIILRPWLFFDASFRRAITARLNLIRGRAPKPRGEPELPGPTISLVGIGVSQAARGERCGCFLMQEFETRARELQVRSMRLSVYPDSVIARKLYEKCGWKPFLIPSDKRLTMYYSKVLSSK